MRITPAPKIYPLKRSIVDLCQRDAFYDFKGKKLTGEILDELNDQFMRPKIDTAKRKRQSSKNPES